MTKTVPPRPIKTAAFQKNANGQGTVYWSKARKRWVGQITLSNGKRPCKVFKLKKDADDWVTKQKHLVAAGQSVYVPHPKMRVDEFLKGWLDLTGSSRAPETVKNYTSAIARINQHLGSQVASKLSPLAIEEMLKQLQIKYPDGENTICNTYTVLRIAYRYAVKMGDFPSNPVEKVTPPKRKVNPSKHIPRGDFKKIYQAASLHPFSYARIELGAIVGARPGEILGLRWSDIDWVEEKITIARQLQRVKGTGLVFRQVKQNQERTVPLTKGTIKILKSHKAFQEMQKPSWQEDLDLIFPNTLGKPLDPKRDRKWWLEVLKRARVPHYNLYRLRKTAYTLLASTGADNAVLLDYTGHSDIATVYRHYAFSTDEKMSMALEKLDSLRPLQ